MRKVAVTGLSGVIGSVLIEELSESVHIIDLFHKVPYHGQVKITSQQHFDLLDRNSIESALENVMPDVIIHLAAITHIDACEKDKKHGKDGIVWKTNVTGAHEIAKFSAKHNIPLIFTSTECVFNGKKEFFSEDDKKNPINWYGKTKSAAENLLLESGAPVTIIRSVVAYHINDFQKTIYGKVLHDLQQKNKLFVVGDQLFTPTHTYDIVHAIEIAMKKNIPGILHVAPQKKLSPFEFAQLIARKNNYPPEKIKKTTLESFYGPERAALRLRNSCLYGEKSNLLLKFIPNYPEKVLQKGKIENHG